MSGTLRPDIEDFRSLGHHATYYNWGIQFLSFPSLLTGFTSADLNARAISMTAPTRTIDTTEINLRGHKAYQHGIVTYNGPLQLQLHETVDSKVGNFLEAWMDLQWTPIAGTQIPKSLNQATFLLTLLDSQDNARQFYTIIGAWPVSFKPDGDYGSNSSDVVKFTVDFRYDYYLCSLK